MVLPLMPKATAVWLIDNTALSFEQIGDFCGMHALEVQGIADDEVAVGIIGQDPIASGQLTREEIQRCEEDTSARLKITEGATKFLSKKVKGARYTPRAKRADKPDAIAWILKNYPDIPDAQVVKLVGTTKNTIAAVRDKSHWNTSNIRPRDPVLLGLCTQTFLDEVVKKYHRTPEERAQGIQN